MIFKEYYFEEAPNHWPTLGNISLSPSLSPSQLASRELRLGSPRASMARPYLLPSIRLLLFPLSLLSSASLGTESIWPSQSFLSP